MKYSISIDHEHKLIRYKHSGLILPDDIGEAWNEFLAMKEFTHLNYNLFSDYRNGKFQIPVKDVSEVVLFMKQIESIVRGKKQALVVDDPFSVAVSMLFENKVNAEVGFNVQLFSTEKEALRWLNS